MQTSLYPVDCFLLLLWAVEVPFVAIMLLWAFPKLWAHFRASTCTLAEFQASHIHGNMLTCITSRVWAWACDIFLTIEVSCAYREGNINVIKLISEINTCQDVFSPRFFFCFLFFLKLADVRKQWKNRNRTRSITYFFIYAWKRGTSWRINVR